MYDDPTHIRAHEIKVRLNDHELALVDALAGFNRQRRAALMRELLMANVRRVEKETIAQQQAI